MTKDGVEEDKSEYRQKTGSPVLLLASKLFRSHVFYPIILGKNVESHVTNPNW